MKKTLVCLALFVSVAAPSFAAAPEAADASRFWGKITQVNAAQKTLTVFNRKRQESATFAWNQTTSFTNDNQPMQPQNLAIGQFLMVAYQKEGDHRLASLVAVRGAPFKKKTTTQ